MCILYTIEGESKRICQLRADEDNTMDLSGLKLVHIEFVDCAFCAVKPEEIDLSNNLLTKITLPEYVSYVDLSNNKFINVDDIKLSRSVYVMLKGNNVISGK